MLLAIAILVRSGNSTPFLIVVLLELLFWIPLGRTSSACFIEPTAPPGSSPLWPPCFERLETERFDTERIRGLQHDLTEGGTRASVAIRRLRWLVEFHDWAHNPFFALFAALVLWSNHLAHAIERWRGRFGHRVARWLQVLGEFEALASLAASLRASGRSVSGIPGRTKHSRHVPRRRPRPPVDSGRAAGAERCPPRRHATPMLVVSGSNMSGKSTLLRTVGVNAVLALAGAPVRAAALRLTPLAIGATLRIQDSLQEGRSRFYAEITRLRDVRRPGGRRRRRCCSCSTSCSTAPTRTTALVGAEGVLRTLARRGAIGLITTHDLALTAIADMLGRGRPTSTSRIGSRTARCVRLPPEAGPGDAEQRRGADAGGGLDVPDQKIGD